MHRVELAMKEIFDRALALDGTVERLSSPAFTKNELQASRLNVQYGISRVRPVAPGAVPTAPRSEVDRRAPAAGFMSGHGLLWIGSSANPVG
jgi:hypothetical protein